MLFFWFRDAVKKIKNGYSECVPITFATPTFGAYSEQKDGEFWCDCLPSLPTAIIGNKKWTS